MSDDVKRSLSDLHEKQDQQTDKLVSLEVAMGKNEAALAQYIRQSDRMAGELKEMNKHLSEYNSELKVHIAGVIELKEQNRLMREANEQREKITNARFETLETPHRWAKFTGKLFAWIGAAATAVTAIVGLAMWLAGRF